MFEKSYEEELEARSDEPVTCLGRTFENDVARRAHYLVLLREGLEELHAKLGGLPFAAVHGAVEIMKSIEMWPMGSETRLRELAERMRYAESDKDLLQRWKDEVGFPHGEIEDILKLSDPPYYTPCPNPFIDDFIQHHAKSYDPKTDEYRREPFAADVIEGKNDPIYKAHSYHTKVPHKAVMRYILHYTEPGDVVFDGFAGTGMTGVAALLCADRKTVESMGYQVDEDGIISLAETDEKGKKILKPFSKLGARRSVLNDLSPVATFIAYNYNSQVGVLSFEREANRILEEVEAECGWMYRTLHEPTDKQLAAALVWQEGDPDQGPTKQRLDLPWGKINYTVWSDVFVCPECTEEVVFWEAAVDKEANKVRKEFACLHCGANLSKRSMERALVATYDKAVGETIRQAKRTAVLINYNIGKMRFEKRPDSFDLAVVEKIEQLDIPYWYPTDPMMFKGDRWGDTWRAGIHAGLTHVHHFYTKRNLWMLSSLISRVAKYPFPEPQAFLRFLFEQWVIGFSLLNRYSPNHYSQNNRNLSGTLYVGSQISEVSPNYAFPAKIKRIAKAFKEYKTSQSSIVATLDTEAIGFSSQSIDYVFTDPPFGGNLMYSELNFLWESWLRVKTNNVAEAITNEVQGKGLSDYQQLMTECFREYYRVMKPGRWMTVEFHNSKNSVWNAIQEALQIAGFVVADVRTLDKKQGSFKQVTSAAAVKQDLIISCYRPNGLLEERFKLTAGTEEGAWDFVRTHANQLPVFVSEDGKSAVIAERQMHLLFDRMVAFHVQRGVTVPLSAGEFYAGLTQRFPERDGMYFLPEQAVEYDKKRLTVKEIQQLQLFVTDEESSILWLKQQLSRKPQTFQELHPQFIKEIGGWQKHEKPLELSDLLEHNFLRHEGKGEVPSQIHSYLSSNYKDLRNLPKDDKALLSKAKDRWYMPDPNKQADLEKLRERTLLKEFEEYREANQKRLKVFRSEAVRAGFKKAWQVRDYKTIIAVAEKIPEKVLQEDPKLLMWYDQAITRNADS